MLIRVYLIHVKNEMWLTFWALAFRLTKKGWCSKCQPYIVFNTGKQLLVDKINCLTWPSSPSQKLVFQYILCSPVRWIRVKTQWKGAVLKIWSLSFWILHWSRELSCHNYIVNLESSKLINNLERGGNLLVLHGLIYMWWHVHTLCINFHHMLVRPGGTGRTLLPRSHHLLPVTLRGPWDGQ